MLVTQGAERGSTGSREMSRRQALSDGKSAHPAIVADPAAAIADAVERGALLPGVDVREAIGAGRLVAGREVDGRDDGFVVTRLGPPRLTLVALVPIITDADEDADDDVAVAVLATRSWDDEQAATVSKTSRADARPTRWRRIPASCRIGARASTRQRSQDGPSSHPMAVRPAVCG
jgi:hypothetical protein